MNNFSRATSALVLTASLLASSVAAFGQTSTSKSTDQAQKTSQTQTQTATQPEAKPADTNATEAKTEQKATPATTAIAKSNKPLSTNENPDMIGKRNINTGLIAKMSGSTEKEVRQGREAAAEVDRQAKFIDDPVITEYVNRVGQNIVLHSDAKVPFTIKVIDSDEVNAFALPGGFFYVNKGLLLAADNEAELAGVMAHEIAHVAARHAVENQTKATLLEYAALGGSIFLGGIPGMIYQNTAGIGLLGIFMKFSRGAEEEADKLGVQYMYAAGYDPGAMATMFEKLEAKNKKKPGFISRAFATHPAPPERRAAALALAARFPEHEEYVISSSEFQRVKARLLRLSNARASSTGAIAAGDEGGAPGRPTLKRRQPTPDDGTTAPADGSEQPKSDAPPKLKKNDGGTTTTKTPDKP
ncbi:MAG TPA: M48 family metallopeptidase [Pyrinomonadaceae bacterium]|jgi:predicted Zn-dependent protease|nr:M48 family metallopeptidase [Pyrinomonadaceae bacterium]